MTMGARPRRRTETRDDVSAAFIEQVSAEDTVQLHCMVPESLHHRFRMMAAERKTSMTALIIEALSDYAREQP